MKAFDLVLSMGRTLYAMRHYVRNAKAGKDAWRVSVRSCGN